MIRKFILEIYSILKDIALFASYSHKVPISFTFNKLPYQNLRILIDIFLTKKCQKKIIKKFPINEQKDYELGASNGIILNQNYFPEKILDNIKKISENLIRNYKQHNIQVDDGGNLEENSKSFSKYYYLPNFSEKLTNEVAELYNILYSNNSILNQLNFLAGLNFKKKDIIIHISKVKGQLLSDDWHSDCFSHTAKAFLYLQNIEKSNSPFCFLKKSHSNINLKILNQKENSNIIFKGNKKKDKLGDEIWNKLEDSNYKNEIFNNSEPVECSFPKSTLITCDTSGFHKKGFSDGQKERFTIGFVTKRGSMYEKFKSAFF
tara:strand:- start:12 stop:968 length:957 start_codon:yes stop_codon:yes gene_type:complete